MPLSFHPPRVCLPYHLSSAGSIGLISAQVVEDRKAGMTAGPAGGHEHFHCSLTPLDPSLVPEQVAAAGGGGAASSSGDRDGEEEAGGLDQPLAVVAAKYYFNGDSNMVFRYRLYSFHLCPVSLRGGGVTAAIAG